MIDRLWYSEAQDICRAIERDIAHNLVWLYHIRAGVWGKETERLPLCSIRRILVSVPKLGRTFGRSRFNVHNIMANAREKANQDIKHGFLGGK